METVIVSDVEHATDGRERERRGLTDALGTTDMAINHYTVPPGERISGLHAHGDQEEVFLVDEGAATVEVFDGEEGRTVEILAGDAVRFAPGEYQSVRNDAAEPLVCFALGAPPDGDDVRIPLACPDCNYEFVRPTLAGDADPVLACPGCSAETPVECPDCGSADMQAVLGDDGAPVSLCNDCGYESETL